MTVDKNQNFERQFKNCPCKIEFFFSFKFNQPCSDEEVKNLEVKTKTNKLKMKLKPKPKKKSYPCDYEILCTHF